MPLLLNNPFASQGGIYDSEGRYIKGSRFIDDDAEDEHLDFSSAVTSHSEVVYIGTMHKTWGHFLTDDMRRLWFLKSREYRENFSDLPVVYLPTGGFELKGNWLRMLEILEIDISRLTPVTQLTRYDKIILPDECFFKQTGYNCHFTKEYAELIDHVREYAISHSHPAHAKKIYVSYSKYKHNKSFGEDKLEKYFASKGYEIFYPENFTLDEQLNALVNCESFASTIGSCSHNVLFLRDNTEVILIPRANYLTEYQLASDHVHRQNIHYIDSSFSIFTHKAPWFGPFLYFISSNLRKYFHDEDTNHIISKSDFRKYLRAAGGVSMDFNLGRVACANNPQAYKYYSTIAAEYFHEMFKSSWLHKLREFLKKLMGRK